MTLNVITSELCTPWQLFISVQCLKSNFSLATENYSILGFMPLMWYTVGENWYNISEKSVILHSSQSHNNLKIP